jgi:hypothetical protein
VRNLAKQYLQSKYILAESAWLHERVVLHYLIWFELLFLDRLIVTLIRTQTCPNFLVCVFWYQTAVRKRICVAQCRWVWSDWICASTARSWCRQGHQKQSALHMIAL